MIGRGLRLHPDKDDCLVLDMASALSTGVVTTPTLFGLDPSELVENASAKDMRESNEQRTRADEQGSEVVGAQDRLTTSGSPRKVTFTDYDSIQELIEDTSGERHIRALSKHAWVQVGDGHYRLTDSRRSFIALEQEDEMSLTTTTNERDKQTRGLYSVRFVERLPEDSNPSQRFLGFKRSRLISKGMAFADAVHAADTLAQKKFLRSLILRNVEWRKKAATSGQLAFLNKLRGADDQLQPSDMTKGAAMDMITKVVYGAKGRFQKLKAGAVRNQKESQKTQAMASREEVRVGPVAP